MIESVKTTSLEKESTVVLGKIKALYETWKSVKQKARYDYIDYITAGLYVIQKTFPNHWSLALLYAKQNE